MVSKKGDHALFQAKKEYLERYWYLNKEINRKLEEREHWHNKLYRITPSYSDMPKSKKSGSSLESAIEKIALLEREINAQVGTMLAEKKTIENAVHALTDGRERLVLKYRYLDFMVWDDISDELGYSIESKHVFALHRKAVNHLKLDIESHGEPVI